MELLQLIATKNAKGFFEYKKLNQTDFYPFKMSKAKLAMTAHILYPKLDKKNVVTLSKTIIKNIIRKKLV